MSFFSMYSRCLVRTLFSSTTTDAMRIEIEREKLLSNYEVYQHLRDIRVNNNWSKATDEPTANPTKKPFKSVYSPDLELITRDVTSYLSKNDIASQSVESITNLMKDLSKFSLEKIEMLQILNSLPHSLVTLYSIVEECDQRFDEDQSNEILDLVNKYFPQETATNNDEDEELLDEDGDTNI